MARKTAEPESEAIARVEAPPEPAVGAPSIAAIPGEDGWYGAADWIRVECDGASPWERLAPREGFAPLWAEIDAGMTFQEAFAIPLEPGTPIARLYPHIAPRIRAWNVREWDPATGQTVPVPPPNEIGIAAFVRCRPLVVEWLAWIVRETALRGGPNRKNETPRSGGGSDGSSGGD